jgi:PAS domain S-box-containing protein
MENKVYGIAEFTFDAGKQIAIQNALQKERDLLEAILEATNDAIIMIDTSRQIVAANLQFEVFFQLPRFELVNRTVDELVEHINAREDLPGNLANLLLTFVGDSNQSAAGDFEMIRQERHILIWYSSAVQANDGTLVGRLFVFRDATHEREVDRMKTEFVSLVSHELRTPLTSIKGFTDFILDGDAGPIETTVREYLNIVKFNADRLLSLINDILDITRIEAGRGELRREMQPIKLLIDASMMSVRSMIQEREQRLTFTLEPDVPPIWVDRNRIVQVMTNLISNASKYTPRGGTLRIEARMLKADSEPVKNMPDNVAVPSILMGIHDSGMGISPKDQPFIFTRFYRTERATEEQIMGTGLGLAIVKSLVELHGGHVWVVSEVDHGASFYFTIPLVEV